MILLYIVTPGRYFLSHRLPLALAAAADGWDVHVATPLWPDAMLITSYGFTLHAIPLARTITSPHQEMYSFFSLVGLCLRLRPQLIHAIAPKAAVFGGLAARLIGIPVVIMKGGLGTSFTEPGLLNKTSRFVIRQGIRAAVSSKARLIVQNEEELYDLAVNKLVRSRASLILGAGVNCENFAPSPEPSGPVVVLLPARMLKSKGVMEFVEAAKILSSGGIKARFVLAGAADGENHAAISRQDLIRWNGEGFVEWIGHCEEMPLLYSNCHIVCLPSHGEGLPKSLTEAAASGRPIVATDVPGCRKVVRHGVNGFLVPVQDPSSLATALEHLIINKEMRRQFGLAGRELAQVYFDERIIIPSMLTIYRDLQGGRL